MVGIAGSRRRQQTSTFRLVRPGRIVISRWYRYAPCFPWRNTCAQGSPPWEKGSMRHRANPVVPAFGAGIAGSTADLVTEIVAGDDADNTTTAGEAGSTAT